MRTARPALPLFLCVLIPASLSAQQTTLSPAPAPITSDPQAVALLQKALGALGAAVTDATLTGTARRLAGSDDETGPATLKATSAGDSRVDLSFPSGNRVEIRNHSALPLPGSLPPNLPGASTPRPVGAWSGPDGVLHAISSNNMLTEATWFLPTLALNDFVSRPDYVLSYVGTETHEGQAVVHLSASQTFQQVTNAPATVISALRHLNKMEIYLDSTTLLPFALAFNAHPDNNDLVDIPTEIRFSGYQAVNGAQVPFHVQRYLSDELVLDLQFSNATLNSGLAATAFQIQ